MVIGGETLAVAVADTPSLRAHGLMEIADLGDLDGMLFVFPGEVEVTFTMRDTLLPLDIWFFTSDGSLVDQFAMTPCPDEACPSYSASAPFSYALETAVGRINPGERLELVLEAG